MASSLPGNAASPLPGQDPPPPHPVAAINEVLAQQQQQQCRQEHVAPSSCFPHDAIPLQSLPPIGSPPMGSVQTQQRQQHYHQHLHPSPFPGSEMASPIRVRPRLPIPYPHASNHGWSAPLQHPFSLTYRHAYHAQIPSPSPAHISALGSHTYLSHGDYGALHSCPGEQEPHLGQFALPVHGNLPGDDAHFGAPALPQVLPPPLPDAPNTSTSVFSADGTGHGGHAFPPSFPFHEVSGDAFAEEYGESWDLRRNQNPVGSSGGGITAGGPKAGFGWLRFDATTNTGWSKEEQAILESGMNEYANQPKALQYAQISFDLQGKKTIRDVALRCRYSIDIVGDCLLNSSASSLDVQEEDAIQNDVRLGENDDTKRLFEQNDLIFNQIVQNQMSLKTEDIISLFDSAYNNIWKLHYSLDNGISEAVSEYLKRLDPLYNMFRPVKPSKSFR